MISLSFVARSDLGSKAIQTFERGWCSHVDAILPDGSRLGARNDVVGGKPAGVQIRPAGYLPWDKEVIYDCGAKDATFNPTAAEERQWYQFLTAQVGKPYDEKAIVAFALGRDWRNPDEWFCSELQAAALEACGFFPYKLSQGVNFITPRDLELVISPWFSVRVPQSHAS